MNKQFAKKIAEQYFPSYPTVPVFHVTSDEQVFENMHDAHNHAKSLEKDKQQVISVDREDEEAKEDTELAKVDDINPEQKLEAAKEALASATEVLSKTQQFLNQAEPKQKGMATMAVKKAEAKVQAAKDHLESVSPKA